MKYFLVVLALLFTACSIKNYEHAKSKIIIIKTSKLKFADLGYLRNTDNTIELELFLAGKVVKKIHINRLICVDEGCLSKNAFNKEYLTSAYPKELLRNILLGQKIYGAKNSIKTLEGFEQSIQTKEVDIKYIVNSKQIYFNDRKNKIIFKIKDLK